MGAELYITRAQAETKELEDAARQLVEQEAQRAQTAAETVAELNRLDASNAATEKRIKGAEC